MKPGGESPSEAPFTLPELQEALLDEGLLRVYLSDLLIHGELRAAQGRGPGGLVRLPPAQTLELFQAGELSAIQVVYAFQGRLWRDTLTRAPQGARLVRISAE